MAGTPSSIRPAPQGGGRATRHAPEAKLANPVVDPQAGWIVAGLLALFYLYAGGLKVLRSPDQLRPMKGWIDTVPLRLVRAIGVLEVLGALGLILPPLTGIAAGLALAAAAGLGLIQVGAISLHLSRGEARLIGLNIAPLALVGAAVWLSTTRL